MEKQITALMSAGEQQKQDADKTVKQLEQQLHNSREQTRALQNQLDDARKHAGELEVSEIAVPRQ